MRVLWFTPTSSQYDKGSHYYHGGGWIESLEQAIIDVSAIELGVSFHHASADTKKQIGKVTYYPIKTGKKGNFGKLIKNWSCEIDSGKYLKKLLDVIADFKPDVIQVFGTENHFAEILAHTKIPVVIHLQGIINPYDNAFYPPGINSLSIMTHLPFFKNHLLGNSLIFDKKRFEKQAVRELSYFKKATYLMGRTCWDNKISDLLAPQASYFHVNEILRSSFYTATPWSTNPQGRLKIISTISNTIYKGLDLILKTASILKETFEDPFEWHIVGLNENSKMARFFESIFRKKFRNCNIVFLGVFSEAGLIKSLKEADIFVHPSYIDNSPNSLCEAQMLGMPVIATNVGGVATLIDHGTTGMLVPANAPYELAHSIALLAKDRIKAAQLGKEACIAALDRHDKAKTISSLLNVYQAMRNK